MTFPEDGSADAAVAPANTFADLQLPAAVLQAVADVGYETPSPIQAATIPALLAGSDVVGLAQTGTGKTAAFAIPILSRIDTASRNTQALVLAPTRELALQVAEAFSRYGAHMPKISVLPIYGGQSYTVQLAGLRRGAHIVVGTPGRIIDHLERGTLDLSHLDYLVLDEADEMLQMGFAEDVERILSGTPEYKQVALFSATMPPAIRKITSKYLHDPVEVTVKSKTATAENITQRYIQVAGPRKMDALTRVLEVEQFEAMIVFVRTKQATEEVAEKLRARGFSAAAINGDIAQAQRERTIAALKDEHKSLLKDIVAVRELDALTADRDREYASLDNNVSWIKTNVDSVCQLLIQHGFITHETKDTSTYAYAPTLLGKVASSMAEANPLITAKMMVDTDYFQKYSSKQLVGLLSCYTDVKVSDEVRATIPSCEDPLTIEGVKRMVTWCDVFEKAERDLNLYTGVHYDQILMFDMIQYAMDWTDCTTEQECKYFIQAVISEKGISVGDFTKAMMKIVTIAREIENVCEMVFEGSQVELLHKLRQIEGMVLKYVLTSQSLYL